MHQFIKTLSSILIFHFLILSSSFSQQQNSIFYLRNGSTYIGEVLDDSTPKLHVRLYDGNEIKFSERAVKRYLPARHVTIYKKGKYHRNRGFFWQMDLTYGLQEFFRTQDEIERVTSHLPFLFGWRFSSKLAVAGGFGIEFNNAEISGFHFGTEFFSNFIYGRYYLMDKRIRPFVYSRIGFGGSVDDSEFEDVETDEGGFQFQGGGGIAFASRKSRKFIFSVGYHLQKASGRRFFEDQFSNEILVDYDILIRGLVMSFGIEFNRVSRGYRR